MPSHLRRYDEPGHIHFWTISAYRRLGFFHDDGVKGALIDGLRLLQTEHGICLIGYVIMPEHVHVLLYPHRRGCDEPTSISVLLHAFKQDTGLEGKERLRNVWRKRGRLWSAPLNKWAQGGFGDEQPLWNVRGHDFNVKTQAAFKTKLDYCHNNPVTRGLVDHPAQWRWSSFRFYEMDDCSVLAMDWDGQWPVIW